MATKEAQIEALLTGQTQRLIMAEGGDPKEGSNYVRMFDVTRAEIDAQVAFHGLPAEIKISTQDSPRDGLYFYQADGRWQLYTKERGCRYDEETCTDPDGAQDGLVSLLLSYCGPSFVHLLGLEEAIGQFDDWDQTGSFLAQVEARLRTAAAKTIFGYLWQEAVSTRHWEVTDSARATRAVKQVLGQRYPTLSPEAVAAVVRAAAFCWRRTETHGSSPGLCNH